MNFIDPFKIIWGILQSWWICLWNRPHVIFSKGGFAAFPAVVGGWLNRVPIVIHESDFTPGLANRLSMPFASVLCINYEEAKQFHKNSTKIEVTGTPIRPGLLEGNEDKGLAIAEFVRNPKKKILLIFGGGLGSSLINETIRNSLPQLTMRYQVIHLCGKGKVDENYHNSADYKQFDYLHDEFADVTAAADIVISRAGANAIYELLALQKPHILIPLSAAKSRGDQIVNAGFFEKKGISKVIVEENLSKYSLLDALELVEHEEAVIKEKLASINIKDGTDAICRVLQKCVDKGGKDE